MGFFEYLAFNNVDAVLMHIGFIGFVVTLIILAIYLVDEDNSDNRIIKRSIQLLIILGLTFFAGLLLPGESYFREMRLRKNMKTIDIIDVNSKLNEIKIDLENINDKLEMEEEEE